jgi:hypothetical protein
MSDAFTVKVFVSGKAENGNGETSLSFTADYNDGANKEWAKYTPSLNLSMVVLNEVAEGINYGDKFTGTFQRTEG